MALWYLEIFASNFDFLIDILVADMASFAKKSRNNRSNLADSNAANTKKKGIGFVEIYIGDCAPASLQPMQPMQPKSQTPKLQKSRPFDIEYESEYNSDYDDYDELQYGELYYCDDCEDKGCNQCARD